jgi:hypothetical protein
MAAPETPPNYELDPDLDYSVGEVVLWVIGILAIPGVPILMVFFLTPFSGM